MINICETFGIEYRVIFNDKKTQCIQFGKTISNVCGIITLNNKPLKWESKVNHLGNMLNQKLLDDDDLKKKKGHFVGSVNKMFGNFINLQSAMLIKLLK